MKAATVDTQNKEDLKYANLVAEGLKELKAIQQEIRHYRSNSKRLQAESAKLMKKTRATLRRVEASI